MAEKRRYLGMCSGKYRYQLYVFRISWRFYGLYSGNVYAFRRKAEQWIYEVLSVCFNNRSKNSLTSIGDGMNCTFEHVCSNL